MRIAVLVLASLTFAIHARKVRLSARPEESQDPAPRSSAAFTPSSIRGHHHSHRVNNRLSKFAGSGRPFEIDALQEKLDPKIFPRSHLVNPLPSLGFRSEHIRTGAPLLAAVSRNSTRTRLLSLSRIQKVIQSSRFLQLVRRRLLGLGQRVRRRPLIPMLFLMFIVSRIWMAIKSPALASAPRPVEITYAAFMKALALKGSAIQDLSVSPKVISFLYEGKPYFTRQVYANSDLMQALINSGIDFRAATTSALTSFLPLLFPILYLFGSWTIMKQAMGGGKTRSVGKKGSSFRASSGDLSFEDVAGIDVAKDEVQEIVSMLKQPGVYAQAGARLPKGVLMAGPPGTGKTLLARVMAAQAGVPFFYCSGSDFVELFVGRGAARMRNLFKEAQKVSPCLIFVDELDALGKQRALRIGGNDEAEQTLNQMLACMDGVDSASKGVIVMAATNRYEILDPALTRPGRFDRVVRINLPDEAGRAAILRVHTRKLKLAPDVDLMKIAEATPSYSGAELAALANEAAIRAVRRGSNNMICQADFLSAADNFSYSRGRMPSVDRLFSSFMPGGSTNNGGNANAP